jgi:hypothetical protein
MKSMLPVAAILTSLVALSGATASADEGPSPARGRRVRVTAPGLGGRPVIGDLMSIEANEVTIRRTGSSEVVAIPRGELMQFEVSTQRRQRGRGAKIGALVGLGVGAVVGFAVGDDCSGPDAPSIVCISRPASAVGLGVVGAGLGAVTGLILAPRQTVWEHADLAGLRVGVMPLSRQSGGMGLALSLSF